jgi:hypothetical protein
MHTRHNGTHDDPPGLASERSGPEAEPAPRSHDATRDADFDDLAAIYLDEPPGRRAGADSRDDTSGNPVARPEARVEALLLGHLPVMAAAWPAQHARSRAEQLGAPVALVRCSAGRLTIELLGAPDTPAPSDEHEARGLVAKLARTIMIRTDEGGEQALAANPRVDRLVVLTGADDASVVACYRTLKSLQQGAGQAPLPPTQLTVVGAPADRGAMAHERIARAAQAFLRADLLEPVVIERIAPTRSRTIYDGPTSHTPESWLKALESTCSDAPLPDRAEAAERPTPAVTGQAPAPSAAPPNPEPPAVPDRPPHLADLLPELTALDLRCPDAPGVALASDSRGRLHLLATDAPGLPGSEHPGDAPGSLLAAQAWAFAHRDLLARAEPALAGWDGNATPHLLTERPERAAALARSALRVYVLAPAGAAAFGRVCVALNEG